MTKQLTLTQLEDLARFERMDISDQENIDYIGYLWWVIQKLDPHFEVELKLDYERYLNEVEENA